MDADAWVADAAHPWPVRTKSEGWEWQGIVRLPTLPNSSSHIPSSPPPRSKADVAIVRINQGRDLVLVR